ncbi:MAG: HlyC/CorC family transporter [Deltaproteobacteria bacterium]|nr:HlyC/CorC family transporter [Deltaproteobacteria bacterium]
MEVPPDSRTILWRLVITAVFVALNGFFVAAEFALVKARGSKIETLAQKGSARAQVATHILNRLDHYLSACQLGITLASLILGWLAEPAVAELLLAVLRAAGVTVNEHGPIRAVAIALAFVVITTFHMTVGEQAPKIWAIQQPESTVLRVSYPLRVFAAIFAPIIHGVNAISNGMLRVAGLSQGTEHEQSPSAHELGTIISSAARAGHITYRQRELAQNILGLVELQVRHILVPRVDVVHLSMARPVEENLRILRESGHSRFPLCETDLDSVAGIVHTKQVVGHLLKGDIPELKKLARPTVHVPDSQPLGVLILELQRSQNHCAVVVDEHGTAVGLAFLEDALEEIVGPIHDEFDKAEPDVRKVSEDVFDMAGSLSLPEAADFLRVGPLGDADTIGGYVVARLGRLPKKGDAVEVESYRLTVTEVSRRRASRLRVEKLAPLVEAAEGSASKRPTSVARHELPGEGSPLVD